jgi:anti-sigma factor RsiW
VKTCEEYQEIVSAYVDGETSAEETAEIFFHLGTCDECRTFMTSLLRLDAFLQTSEDAATRRPAAAKQPLWKRTLVVPYPVAAAVAALLFITASLFVFQKTQPPEVISKTETAYVYVMPLPPVDVVASPLPANKTN